MKVLRFLAVSAVCVALALFMVVHSFAISRFDAYSYWANAQNQVSFIGNDIINFFNYSKSTGLNPPSSIQSDFYKNGYYSNNIALFNQHSGGTASFDLNSLQPVYSWTFNGENGTSPLNSGFVTDNGASLWLTTEAARLGPYNGNVAKNIVCDTSEQIAVYEFRVRRSGISDATNFSRIQVSFMNDNQIYSFCFTFNSTQYGIENGFDFFQGSFGGITGSDYDFTVFHDLRVVVEGISCSIYLDNVLLRTFNARSSGSDSAGVRIGSFKYSNTDIYSYSFKALSIPTTTVIVSLGRSVLIPAGDDMEFYVHLRNGSVTNVTTQTTVDLDFSLISQMSLIFNEQLAMVPIEYDNDWLYVKVPSADVDRTFAYCSFTAQTPYVNTTTGDQLRWDMEMAFSDLVFGDPDDIGLNPDIDPEQDKFRNEVIGGINDVKQEIHDGFDIINGTLEDVRQEVANGFDSINDAIYGDQPDVTIAPELNPEEVLGESQAIDDYMGIINDAQDGLVDYLGVEAPGWIQNFFGKILSWTGIFPFIALLLPITVVRALLGR